MKTGLVVNGLWRSQYPPIGRAVGVSLIVNNMALARSLQTAGKFVIHRYTNPSGFHDEGYNAHRNIPHTQYAEKLIQAHGYDNIDIPMYATNEASTSLNLTAYRDMCQYFANTYQYIHDKGFTVYGWNSPPASHDSYLVDNGAYDPLINFFSANRDRAVMCFHDYDDFTLVRFNNDEKDYKRLDDPNYVAWSKWSEVINPASSWHLYHYTRVIERARLLNKPIRAGLTELGWSNIPDNGTASETARLNAMFTRTPVNDSLLNGQMTLGAYWKHVYPQSSLEEAIKDQLAHYVMLTRKFYPEVEFFTFYAYKYGEEHGQHVSDETISTIASMSQAPTAPSPTGRPVVIRPAGNYDVNVRAQPTTASPILGTIFSGKITTLVLYETSRGWREIGFNGGIAYVSAKFTTVSDVVQPNPVTVTATYTYNTNDSTEVATHQQIQGLIARLR